MSVTRLTDLNSIEFKSSLEIYKSSFPLNEVRPVEKIVEMLKGDKNYHLFTCLKDNSVVGISLMYVFRSLGIGFLDYMAVSPKYQRQGLGKKIFEHTFEEFRSDIPDGIGLLMEIQRDDVPDLSRTEIDVRRNRIRFYTLLGAKILKMVRYLLPPIQYGIEPEEMYIMIKPLTKLQYISRDSVIQYIKAIYSTIYQYPHGDLLNKLSEKLPHKIILDDMMI